MGEGVDILWNVACSGARGRVEVSHEKMDGVAGVGGSENL